MFLTFTMSLSHLTLPSSVFRYWTRLGMSLRILDFSQTK